MNRRSPTVSVKDVAALAQVSVGTVSNVLNSPDRVARETRLRVAEAIDVLGWVRNESARHLRSGSSHSIGMVIPDAANPYFTDIARGAEDFLYAQGYSVFLGNSAQSALRQTTLVRTFAENRVGGVLLAPIGNTFETLAELRRTGIPTVLMDTAADANGCSVKTDDVRGGHLAISHLLEQGYTRIACLGGPLALRQVRDRFAGARAAAAVQQVPLSVIETNALSIEEGLRAGELITSLESTNRPRAVFAANDLLAIGLVQKLTEKGWSVPHDIAIVGYGDIRFAAAAAIPLTSVRPPRYVLGEKAASLLLAEIEAEADGVEHRHESVQFIPELIPRLSSVLAPADHAATFYG